MCRNYPIVLHHVLERIHGTSFEKAQRSMDRKTQQLKDNPMRAATWIWFVLAVVLLAFLYSYLLLFLVGYAVAIPRPSWWEGIFASRHFAMLLWLTVVHTIAVFAAAAPIALLSLVSVPARALLVGVSASALAIAVQTLPSLSPEIWPLIWNNNPTSFFIDTIKCVAAVPVLIWLLRKLPSNTGWSGRAMNKLQVVMERRVAHSSRKAA